MKSGMGALGRQDKAVPALAFAKPLAQEFFAPMTPAWYPFSVYLSGVQNVATGFEIPVNNSIRNRVFDNGTKLRCSKAEHRSFQVGAWD